MSNLKGTGHTTHESNQPRSHFNQWTWGINCVHPSMGSMRLLHYHNNQRKRYLCWHQGQSQCLSVCKTVVWISKWQAVYLCIINANNKHHVTDEGVEEENKGWTRSVSAVLLWQGEQSHILGWWLCDLLPLITWKFKIRINTDNIRECKD